MRMKLTDDRSHYILETMSGRSITLSLSEMDQLAALIDQLRSQLKPSSSRVSGAMATTRISDVVVGIDRHHTEVILRLKDQGFEHAYVLSSDTARGLRDGINFQLEGIETAKNKRSTQ
jgi:hypothetical protein